VIIILGCGLLDNPHINHYNLSFFEFFFDSFPFKTPSEVDGKPHPAVLVLFQMLEVDSKRCSLCPSCPLSSFLLLLLLLLKLLLFVSKGFASTS
jgi:hypothetical protein